MGQGDEPDPMWSIVPRLPADHRYLVLGTVDRSGSPWVTPLLFAADGAHRLLWVSSPESRHFRNLAATPAVALTLFDTAAPIGGAEAGYADALAGPVDEADRPAALRLLNERLLAHQRLEPEDVGPAGPLRISGATVTRHSALLRGDDPRSETGVDTAPPVHHDRPP